MEVYLFWLDIAEWFYELHLALGKEFGFDNEADYFVYLAFPTTLLMCIAGGSLINDTKSEFFALLIVCVMVALMLANFAGVTAAVDEMFNSSAVMPAGYVK